MRPTISLSMRATPPPAPMLPWRAVAASVAIVALWALWAAAFNTAQFGDNIEQFNWAQSLELGYHKHPPLPSWLLGGVIKAFGPSVYWAYVLATLCLLGTIVFTWLIGRELLGPRLAAAAVVLWGLNLTFSQRAQLYNHNTVLVLCVAATVWFTMRATRPGRRQLAWWAAAGLGGGAAMLSKYQAAVPLAALLWVLAGTGRLKRPAQWGGLLLALAILVAVCAPHAAWVARHDFSTLRYASDAIENAGARERIGFVLAFFANQVRIWFPALLALGVYALIGRFHARAAPGEPAAIAPDVGAWMFALIGAGVLVLLAMALAFGVSLRNHWGVQVLQFFCLWVAWRWERRAPIDLRHLVWTAVLVHAASLAWYATEHHDPGRVLSSKRRIDTMYPARRLARSAVAHWTATTACPLRYVAGTVFDAGLVSLYSGGRLEVFDSETATPWIHPDALRRSGVLYVLDGDDAVPPGVTHVVEFDLAPRDHSGGEARTIRLGVRLPQQPCR